MISFYDDVRHTERLYGTSSKEHTKNAEPQKVVVGILYTKHRQHIEQRSDNISIAYNVKIIQ